MMPSLLKRLSNLSPVPVSICSSVFCATVNFTLVGAGVEAALFNGEGRPNRFPEQWAEFFRQ